MKPELMEFLVCPLCHAEMTLTIGTETGGEIIDGSLKCTKCAEKYPIEDGIPNLLPPGHAAVTVMDPHHGMMGENGEPLHEPAAPDAPFDYLRNPLLPQGAGLAGLALGALLLLAKLWRTHWMLGVLALPLLGVAALFAAWAAAIHLTGGEKLDDHPWV